MQKWLANPENRGRKPDFCKLVPSIEENHLAVASYLLENFTSVDQWHFETAMRMESYPFMELFLHHGYDINLPLSEYYTTPLAYSFEKFHNEEMTRSLLDHGANPNAETEYNNTPLSRAIHIGSMSVIKLLFERGGPESMNHGDLLIFASCRILPNRIEVLEYLLTTYDAQRNINKLRHQDHTYLSGTGEHLRWL